MSIKSNLFVLLSVILIGAGLAVFSAVLRKSKTVPPFPPYLFSPPSQGLRVGNNAIYVPEQPPGSHVTIGFVVLAQPGFVVIHEDRDDAPGAIVGASSLLMAGETQKIGSIVLSREMQEGEEQYAMLHVDNGDGAFDAATDLPVKDERENIIMMQFAVDRDASEPGEISL